MERRIPPLEAMQQGAGEEVQDETETRDSRGNERPRTAAYTEDEEHPEGRDKKKEQMNLSSQERPSC